MKRRYKSLSALLAILLLGTAVFSLWASRTPEAGEWAGAVLTGDETYLAEPDKDWIRFIPHQDYKGTVIFYPGGKVSAESYAPLAASLAASGYEVFLLRMPLNMAFFAMNKADRVIKAYPDRVILALAGHSLGGVAAASYWDKSSIPGLILLASYPSRALERKDPILAVYGSNDGLVTEEDRIAIRDRTAPGSVIVELAGGNHAQFGDYGIQKGDGTAEISPMEQNARTAIAIYEYLGSIAP